MPPHTLPLLWASGSFNTALPFHPALPLTSHLLGFPVGGPSASSLGLLGVAEMNSPGEPWDKTGDKELGKRHFCGS